MRSSSASPACRRPQLVQHLQSSGGVGRASTDAGGHRQILLQRQARAAGLAARSRGPILQRAGGAQDQIVIIVAGQRRGEGAGHLQRQSLGAFARDLVADVGEGGQAAEFVIAVGALGADVQKEIDLGRREGKASRGRAHLRP